MGVPREILQRLSAAKCIICDKVKENRVIIFCNNCAPFIYKEGKKPHQQIRLTKEWKLNRKKRLDKANYKCKWCGNQPETGLTVHHNNHIDYYKIWYGLINKYLEEMNEKNEEWRMKWDKAWQKDSITKMMNKVKNEIDKEAKSSKVEACPHCDSSQLSKRKEKKPKYYCSNCKKEFDIAKIRSDKKYYVYPNRIEKIAKSLITQRFIKKIIKHSFDKLRREYQEEVKKQVSYYLSMRNTEVLCKRCHMAAENNMKLCPICKERYHRIQYNTCAECYKLGTG